MNQFKKRLLLVTLFVIGAGLFSPIAAFGQSDTSAPDATMPVSCTYNGGTNDLVDPSVSKSGYPVDGFDYTPPATPIEPKPENPVQKACQEGKVQVLVGNKQEFGNRIGAIIEVRVLLLVDNDVALDFNSLQHGILKLDGTDVFHLALDNGVNIAREQRQGKVLYTIDLRVQTFVPAPSVPFSLDLKYSTSFVEGTFHREWQVLTTPDFLVTTSNTVDNGEQLLEGTMVPAPVVTPWLTRVLTDAGWTLLLSWPIVALLLWLIRKRPGRKIPANEAAWAVFTEVIADGNQSGYKERHCRALADALKGYLGVATRSREEISDILKDDPRLSTIISALKKLDTALYDGTRQDSLAEQDLLSKKESAELLAQIEELVPKP